MKSVLLGKNRRKELGFPLLPSNLVQEKFPLTERAQFLHYWAYIRPKWMFNSIKRVEKYQARLNSNPAIPPLFSSLSGFGSFNRCLWLGLYCGGGKGSCFSLSPLRHENLNPRCFSDRLSDAQPLRHSVASLAELWHRRSPPFPPPPLQTNSAARRISLERMREERLFGTGGEKGFAWRARGVVRMGNWRRSRLWFFDWRSPICWRRREGSRRCDLL